MFSQVTSWDVELFSKQISISLSRTLYIPTNTQIEVLFACCGIWVNQSPNSSLLLLSQANSGKHILVLISKKVDMVWWHDWKLGENCWGKSIVRKWTGIWSYFWPPIKDSCVGWLRFPQGCMEVCEEGGSVGICLLREDRHCTQEVPGLHCCKKPMCLLMAEVTWEQIT